MTLPPESGEGVVFWRTCGSKKSAQGAGLVLTNRPVAEARAHGLRTLTTQCFYLLRVRLATTSDCETAQRRAVGQRDGGRLEDVGIARPASTSSMVSAENNNKPRGLASSDDEVVFQRVHGGGTAAVSA